MKAHEEGQMKRAELDGSEALSGIERGIRAMKQGEGMPLKAFARMRLSAMKRSIAQIERGEGVPAIEAVKKLGQKYNVKNR